MSLQQRTDVDVACHGELVLLGFGNVRYTLEFPLALQIAALMKHEARMAKANSGVDWPMVRALAVLHDAAAPKRKRFAEKLPELLNARQVDVRAEGQMVALSFGNATRRMHWSAARTISQWLRVRGKEAKRYAGEHAHWSRVINAEAAAHGALA